MVLGLACSGTSDPPATTTTTTATANEGGGGSGGSSAMCTPAASPFGTDPSSNESFPDLELRNCEGSTVELQQIRCQSALTLLSVGAGWCEPCKAEAPLLQEAAEKLSGQNVQIIQLLFQDAASLPATTVFCQNWVETYSLSIGVYIDPVGSSLDYFDVATTPLNVIIDRNGKVLWATVGIIEDDIEQLLLGYL